PLVERERLNEQGRRLTTRIAELERAQAALLADTALAPGEKKTRGEEIEKQLAAARDALYQHYREARASSATYKRVLEQRIQNMEPPRLGELQRRLVREDGLMLLYLLGQDAGYLMVIDANQAHVQKLAVDAATAKTLGIDAGPLTGARMLAALMNDGSNGVLQLLDRQNPDPSLTGKLAALARVLLPDAELKTLTSSKLKRLVIVPDGPLAFL